MSGHSSRPCRLSTTKAYQNTFNPSLAPRWSLRLTVPLLVDSRQLSTLTRWPPRLSRSGNLHPQERLTGLLPSALCLWYLTVGQREFDMQDRTSKAYDQTSKASRVSGHVRYGRRSLLGETPGQLASGKVDKPACSGCATTNVMAQFIRRDTVCGITLCSPLPARNHANCCLPLMPITSGIYQFLSHLQQYSSSESSLTSTTKCTGALSDWASSTRNRKRSRFPPGVKGVALMLSLII